MMNKIVKQLKEGVKLIDLGYHEGEPLWMHDLVGLRNAVNKCGHRYEIWTRPAEDHPKHILVKLVRVGD